MSQNQSWKILLLLVIVCAGCQGFAQGGPPLITDDPGTPGNRHWEINAGLTLDRLRDQTDFETPLLDLNYGAGDHTQVKFEIPYVVQSENGATRTGLGNSKLGVKWRFVDEDKHGIAVSTYPQLTFNNPTSSVRRGVAHRGWGMFLPAEFSRKLGKFELDGEVGYNVKQHLANELWLGLCGAYEASKRAELLAELHSISSHRLAENESVFDLGARIKITKLNSLLFAAGRSLPGSTAQEPRFFMYAGIQFAF